MNRKKVSILLIFFTVLLLTSCSKTDESIITYSSDDIYLNCVEHGSLNDYPEELLILDSEAKWEEFTAEYGQIAELLELEALKADYPAEEYAYVLECFDRDFGTKVKCKGLVLDKEEKTVRFEYKINSPGKDGPTAISYFVTYAVLPKAYLREVNKASTYEISM